MQEILWVIFAISGGILFFFYFSISIAFAFYKSPSSCPDGKTGVSVIICAYNELNNLKANIMDFLHQDYPAFEVIVVDDRSSDGTYDFLFNLKEKNDRLRIVRIDETPDHIDNKKYAITLGVRAAKHDIILLSDADCRPAGDQWIKGMAAPFVSKKIRIALGYSQYLHKKGLLNALIRFDTFWTGLQYTGLALLGKPYMGVGRNLAYRKSLFLDSRGFGRYQHITGGDDDLFVKENADRHNTAVVMSPETLVVSKPKTSRKAFNAQKTRHLSTGKHYRPFTRMLLGMIFMAKFILITAFIPVILSARGPLPGVFILTINCLAFLAAILLFKKRTGDPARVGWFPLLDIVYIFYYLTTGVKVIFTKKVRWN